MWISHLILIEYIYRLYVLRTKRLGFIKRELKVDVQVNIALVLDRLWINARLNMILVPKL